jgi:hypothetical protein
MSRRRIAQSTLPIVTLVVAYLATACGADVSRTLIPSRVDTTGWVKPLPLSPALPFADPSRPATIFVAADDTSRYGMPGQDGVLLSRYVFYEDSTFALQFYSASRGQFEYTGRVARADSVLDLRFDGASIAGPWIATGTLRGDTLSVSYNQIMVSSDFADGNYLRAR